jgi:hypothetical protein
VFKLVFVANQPIAMLAIATGVVEGNQVEGFNVDEQG